MKEELKLYHLNSNSNDEDFFTIASNKQEAFKNILERIKLRYKNEPEGLFTLRKNYMNSYYKWIKVNPLNKDTFPDFYTLDEHYEGDVISV